MLIQEHDNFHGDAFAGIIKKNERISKQITFTLTNNTGTEVKLAITPGGALCLRPIIPVANAVPVLGETPAQTVAVAANTLPFMAYDNPEVFKPYIQDIDCVLDDGLGATKALLKTAAGELTVVTERVSIREFFQYCRTTHMDLKKIRFEANAGGALTELEIIEFNPFNPGSIRQPVTLSSLVSENQFQDNIIEFIPVRDINTKLQLDETTAMILKIPASVTTPAGVVNPRIKITFDVNFGIRLGEVTNLLKHI